MTGTADTEAFEHQIYGLSVVVIPTNKPVQRKTSTMWCFLLKWKNIRRLLKRFALWWLKKRPILVGTAPLNIGNTVGGT